MKLTVDCCVTSVRFCGVSVGNPPKKLTPYWFPVAFLSVLINTRLFLQLINMPFPSTASISIENQDVVHVFSDDRLRDLDFFRASLKHWFLFYWIILREYMELHVYMGSFFATRMIKNIDLFLFYKILMIGTDDLIFSFLLNMCFLLRFLLLLPFVGHYV